MLQASVLKVDPAAYREREETEAARRKVYDGERRERETTSEREKTRATERERERRRHFLADTNTHMGKPMWCVPRADFSMVKAHRRVGVYTVRQSYLCSISRRQAAKEECVDQRDDAKARQTLARKICENYKSRLQLCTLKQMQHQQRQERPGRAERILPNDGTRPTRQCRRT